MAAFLPCEASPQVWLRTLQASHSRGQACDFPTSVMYRLLQGPCVYFPRGQVGAMWKDEPAKGKGCTHCNQSQLSPCFPDRTGTNALALCAACTTVTEKGQFEKLLSTSLSAFHTIWASHVPQHLLATVVRVRGEGSWHLESLLEVNLYKHTFPGGKEAFSLALLRLLKPFEEWTQSNPIPSP